MSVKRLNMASMEFTGEVVLPQNSHRTCFMIQVKQGNVFIEFGGNNGFIKLKEGETFSPVVTPTSSISIVGGTYVILTNTLPDVALSNGVPDMSAYVPEVNFVDLTTQTTSGSDVLQNVRYGAALASPKGFISIDNAGVITILKTGFFLIKTRHRWVRAGSTGTSRIFQWVELSLDGVTWIPSGNSIDISLSASDDVQIFNDVSAIFLQAGTKIRARWARSSTGHNSGQMEASVPSAGLTTGGAMTAPSAQLTVYIPFDQS